MESNSNIMPVPAEYGYESDINRIEKGKIAMENYEDQQTDEYVPEIDEASKDQQAFTVRIFIISTLFNMIVSFVNQLGVYRKIQFSLGPIFPQILVVPVITALARCVPRYQKKIFGYNFDTNPGPFTAGEHMLVAVALTDAGQGNAYVSNTLYYMETLLGQNIGFFGDFLTIFVTKFIGLGLAGVFAKYLLIDKVFSWPSAIYQAETIAMFHQVSNEGGTAVVRNKDKLKWFGIYFLIFFVYQWLPQLFAPALGSIAILCFFSGSKLVGDLGSGNGGFGMLSIGFDPSIIFSFFPYIPYIEAHYSFNLLFGGILWAWIISPILYYSNFAYAQNFDIIGFGTYLKNGSAYPWDELISPSVSWNETLYEELGHPYGNTWFFAGYGFSFMAFTSAISHAICWYGPLIKARLFGKDSTTREDSIHAIKLQERYPTDTRTLTISGLIMTLIVLGLFIMSNSVYDYQFPWWAIICSVLMAIVFILPIGIIQGMTGMQVGLNILCEMLGGIMLPHNPNGAILVKVTGYMGMTHALNLIQNMKAGQYIGLSYMTVFIMQAWGTLVCSFADALAYRIVMNANLVNHVKGWHSQALEQYVSAANMWGGLGAVDMWMTGPYALIFWTGIVGGFALPVIFWALSKRWAFFKYVNVPMWTPCAAYSMTNSWYGTILLTIYLFRYYAPKYHPEWFKNYLFVSYGGITGAFGLAAVIWQCLNGFAGVDYPDFPLANVQGDFFCFSSVDN